MVGAWVWREEFGFGVATEVDVEEALATYYEIRTVIYIFSILAALTLMASFKVIFSGYQRVLLEAKARLLAQQEAQESATDLQEAKQLGDIGELLLDVCERQAEISPDHQCNVDVEKLPKEMWFDPNLLDHVFTNLLSNAVKYSPQDPHIEVKGWQGNEEVVVNVITVTDHGVGIPEDDLPHMFGRFFRASTAEGIKGTGLGLSVCKEFVEMHGGTIEVASVDGEGSTFTVRLPTGDRDQ